MNLVTERYVSESTLSIGIASQLASDLVAIFDAALARVWLLGPGDRCARCPMAPGCLERTACLHLVASAGLTARIDGQFARFPLDAPPVGQVARALTPLLLRERLAASGLADPAWFGAHRIASFGAWPIARCGTCAGVLALFSRRVLDTEDERALAAFARLASHALVADALAEDSARASTPLPTLAETQRDAILRALHATGGRVSGPGGAAERLGVKPTTLESRIRRLGMRKPPRSGRPTA